MIVVFHGETAGGGYTVFKFGLEIKKKHYYKDLGYKKWVVEECYIVPNDSLEERRDDKCQVISHYR